MIYIRSIVNLGTLCREKLGYQQRTTWPIKLQKMSNSKKLWNQLKTLGYSNKKKENGNVVLENRL